MSVMPRPTTEILRSIERSKTQIDAAIVEIHATVSLSRAQIELTRAWLRELDQKLPLPIGR